MVHLASTMKVYRLLWIRNVELTETIAMRLSQIENSAEIGTHLVFEDCGIRRASIRSTNYARENTTVSIPLE